MITIFTIKKNKNFKLHLWYLIKFFYLLFSQKLFLDLKRLNEIIIFSGHIDVTKSLVNGLKENKIKYNINPKNKKDVFKKAIVLSGLDELKLAIKLKEEKYIQKLFAGPNICVLPRDIKYLFNNKNIDKIITPSKWVSNSYEDEIIDGINRISEWPAGLDINYWKPKKEFLKNYVLIYLKNNYSKKTTAKYLNYLKKNNIKFRILKYGSYNTKNYLKLLRYSHITVFFSKSESQGLALLQSWSVNVPSLVLENKKFIYKGKKIICDTAPYLSSQTGLKFNDLNEFKKNLKFITNNINQFNPRLWVLNNLTDKLSTKILLKKFDEV